jgi:hypothetical protein
MNNHNFAVGDWVRCRPAAPDSFPGRARILSLTYTNPGYGFLRPIRFVQVYREDGEIGGGDTFDVGGSAYQGWLISPEYLKHDRPRAINEPPQRYGPYMPVAKALP